MRESSPRNASVHEAGHAVAYWLLGLGKYIRDIDMRGDAHSLGVVHYEGPGLAFWKEKLDARVAASWHVTVGLAGRCAMSLDESPEHDWFQQLRAEWKESPTHEPAHDITCVVEGVRDTLGKRDSLWRFIGVRAKWTTELLRHPRVWPIVEAMATRLLQEPRLSGNDARDVMAGIWGQSEQWPILQLGPEWGKRFASRGRCSDGKV